ncbi:NepR family anti-sigma factor [Tropicimonas sp. IMCC34011]|uniref:NepR family anti-sigma factor n=1 Tax=Tropicimonas sp. IMCC34011 TaxID=2248759 RepID=UPI00351A4B93
MSLATMNRTTTESDAGYENADPERTEYVDANLRRAYNEMLQEEVPDRFTDLLRQLREQDNAQ